MANLKNTTIDDTGFIKLPEGTSAQRPGNNNGRLRFNSNKKEVEFNVNSSWKSVDNVFKATGGKITYSGLYKIHTFTGSGTFTVANGSTEIDYIVIGGGGPGGSHISEGYSPGGGGAGGLAYAQRVTVSPNSYSVTIGAGGVADGTGRGSNGIDSVFNATTALGGGSGGGYNGSSHESGAAGGSGGGNDPGAGSATGGAGSQGNSGSATGYGNAGGGGTYTPYPHIGGGGGGAGQAGGRQGLGGRGYSTQGGDMGKGGDGLPFDIDGTVRYYAGGGGGGPSYTISPFDGGEGGLGGGGDGAKRETFSNGQNGWANTGGGAGAGNSAQLGAPYNRGGNGGSGVVIIRYLLDQSLPARGGTVTITPTHAVHAFRNTGVFAVLDSSLTGIEFLIVAGGGGGGASQTICSSNHWTGGGGGAGGLLTNLAATAVTLSSGNYPVTVGSGGRGAKNRVDFFGVKGGNSTFNGLTALGGGGGETRRSVGFCGQSATNMDGGSGGGCGDTNPGTDGGRVGAGTAGQGNNGGQGFGSYGAGGGGGAGAVGGNGDDGGAGNGGVGGLNGITGTPTYYAGGGGGGIRPNIGQRQGLGGAGGGGNGNVGQAGNDIPRSGYNGSTGTGGGGGGGGDNLSAPNFDAVGGGNGGSGIVIIRYPLN